MPATMNPPATEAKDDLVSKIAAHQGRQRLQAATAYAKIIVAVADGDVIDESVAADAVTAVGKSAEDLVNDAAVLRRRRALVATVAKHDGFLRKRAESLAKLEKLNEERNRILEEVNRKIIFERAAYDRCEADLRSAVNARDELRKISPAKWCEAHAALERALAFENAERGRLANQVTALKEKIAAIESNAITAGTWYPHNVKNKKDAEAELTATKKKLVDADIKRLDLERQVEESLRQLEAV